jgi:DNA-binding CsgD family transcriptional regulator
MSAPVQNETIRGREAVARKAWSEAFEALSRADAEEPLGADDLEALATAAYMLGRDDEYLDLLQRAHHGHLETGEPRRAVLCAFWIGITLVLRGELGPGSGWLGRAQRLVEQADEESVERGYLRMPAVFEHEARGDFDAAAEIAGEAAAIAQRFGDPDAFALAAHTQGRMLIKAGRVHEGLALLDEAMVGVMSGHVSPIPTGIVYCAVILACQAVYEPRRAAEWTDALSRWGADQPDLVAFTGRCLVHRAEIKQLRGEWADALDEARRASDRFALQVNPGGSGVAFYRQGELLRLLGELAGAEEAYGDASRHGWDPQPGLAQLRLAQGKTQAAMASIRRALGETVDPLKRAALLPAHVEIMLAAKELDEARAGCGELQELAGRYESAMLGALAAHARGSVALAEGDAAGALVALREACRTWRDLDAPYEDARARVLVALACRALGDDDAAERELEAARSVFTELGASPDLERLDASTAAPASAPAHGLTARELEVLRLVVGGKSNKEIAAALVISEHTAARHMQNIFAKLDVSSRAAAVAFAYEQGLV